MGINLLDIDRYKKVFDSYDKNKSGVLENLGLEKMDTGR